MNPARQFLHLFLKDIRRHALEIGLVLLLNLGLALALTETWEESLTFDEFGMMFGDAAQLLLVLTWCVLIGRVVQDDGVAGKAPYWLTRPYDRPMLLASKLAFVLLFIHLPLFLSHLAIVSGSGLPLSFAQMLVDQVVLAACISLPAMTLAALTTTFSRFVFGGVAATGVLMFAVAAVDPWSSRFVIGAFPSSPGSYFVLATALAILVSITGVALACQYRWRATLRVAVTSVVALSLLGLVLLTLPTTFVMRARAAVVRPATVATTIRFRAGAEPRIVNVNPEDIPQIRLVLLPIDLTDTGESTLFTYKVDIRGAAGSELELMGGPEFRSFNGANIRRTIYGDDVGESWLDLRMSPSEYDSLKDEIVSVHFIAEIATFEIRETEPIPRDGSSAIVDGRAQCGLPSRGGIVCRSSSGWTTHYVDLYRQVGVQQLWLPVRLRFAIDPIVTDGVSGTAVDAATTPAIPTSVGRRVSYTRQDVTFENIRLGDWGPE